MPCGRCLPTRERRPTIAYLRERSKIGAGSVRRAQPRLGGGLTKLGKSGILRLIKNEVDFIGFQMPFELNSVVMVITALQLASLLAVK